MNRIWTPESVPTAHLITRYKAGLLKKYLPHHNGERNNVFVFGQTIAILAQKTLPMIMIFPAPTQHLNLTSRPGGMREAV